MNILSNEELSALSTLAYYHALGVPSLTAMEILRYWMPRETAAEISTPSLRQLFNCLDELREKRFINMKNGYVALSVQPQQNFFEQRIEAKKQGIAKRHICLRYIRLLPYVPHVRAVALAGSLATDNANEQSDIDILITSTTGRIWTARILVTVLFQLLGKRRHGKKIANRICLNHYVALDETRALHLLPEALTTAHIYAQAIPLWGEEHFRNARPSNPWLASHLSLPLAPTLFTASHLPHNLGLSFKKTTEIMLRPLWIFMEAIGGSLQKKHISKKLIGKNVDPLEVIVGESTLLFHYPFSRSKHTLAQYERQMQSFMLE